MQEHKDKGIVWVMILW